MTLGKSFTICIPSLCLSQWCSFNRNSFRGQFFTGRATAALRFAIITGEASRLHQMLPTGMTEKKQKKNKQKKQPELVSVFLHLLLVIIIIPASLTHTQTTLPPQQPSALFQKDTHVLPKYQFRAGVQSLLLSEIHSALATWQSLQITQWVFLQSALKNKK